MSDYLRVAEQIAREAGAIVREGYGQALDVEYKGETDLVTVYDKRSEALLLNALRQAFPEHSIHAEESGRAGSSDYEWLIDPLDGTTNFAHGFPMFAVSVALVWQRRPVVGVVYDPLRDELFSAEAGQGARLNGAPLKVSATSQITRALLATGFPYDVWTNPHNNFAEFIRVHRQVQGMRRGGSAALDCTYVGAGRLDGYWEFGIKPWDVAAGALVTREAGGRATTIGAADDFLGHESIVVTNGHLHPALLAALKPPQTPESAPPQNAGPASSL